MKFRLLGYTTLVFSIFGIDFANAGVLKKFFQKSEDTKVSSPDDESEEDDDEDENNEKSEGTAGPSTASDSVAPVAHSSASVDKPAAPATTPAAVPAAPKKEIKGDPVVAKVGRLREFHRSDVLKILSSLPPQLSQGIPHERLFDMCLRQLISSFLMVEQAKKAGMDKTKEFQERLEALKGDLLARMFLMKEIMPKAENQSTLQARYAKYVVDFKPVRETQIFHIMVSTDEEAKKIIAKLDGGEDFKKLAKEKSIAPSKENSGEEGFIAISVLPSPVKEKLQELKKGEYSKEPLKTETGYHIFKVGDSRDSTHQKFEDIQDSLKQMIVQEEIMKLMDRLFKQFNVEVRQEDGSPLVAVSNTSGATAPSGGTLPRSETASGGVTSLGSTPVPAAPVVSARNRPRRATRAN